MNRSQMVLLLSSLAVLLAGCAPASALDAAGGEASDEETFDAEQVNSSIGFNGLASSEWPWPQRSFAQSEATPDALHLYTHAVDKAKLKLNGSYPYPSKLNLQEIRDRRLREFKIAYTGEPMDAREWHLDTARAGRFFAHIVQCALGESVTVRLVIEDKSEANNERLELRATGHFNLAPQWEDGGISADEEAQELITGCMGATMNKYGLPVRVSLRNPDHTSLSEALPSYHGLEGAYWGNMFREVPEIYTCDNDDAETRRLALLNGRECQLGHCANIERTGRCDDICKKVGGTAPVVGYRSCAGHQNVMTLFVGDVSMDEETFTSSVMPAKGNNTFPCKESRALYGISTNKDGEFDGVLCKKSGLDLFRDDSSTTLTASETTDRSSRALEWQGESLKIECAEDEYIGRISGRDGALEKVSCMKGNVHGDYCRAVSVGASDADSLQVTTDEWSLAAGARVAQCGLGEHAVGVAFTTGGTPTGLLCCID